MKVAINACFGGFSLSPQAVLWLFENGYDEEGFKSPAKEYFGHRLERLNEELVKWRAYKNAATKESKDKFSLISRREGLKMEFEQANGDNPQEIIIATQRSLIKAIKGVISDVRKDTKAPGLTWEQLDYLLDKFKDKEPTVVFKTGDEINQ